MLKRVFFFVIFLPNVSRAHFFDRVFQNIEETRTDISQDIVGYSNDLDAFFSRNRTLYTRNATNIRLSNASSLLEGQGYQNDFDIRIRLKLPRTEDKLQFEFDQAVDDFQTGTSSYRSTRSSERESGRQRKEPRSGVSLYQRFFETDLRLSTGFHIKKQLVPWTSLRTRNDLFFNSKKNHFLQLVNEFYGESLDGTRHESSLSYNYQFNSTYFLRQNNESQYRDKDHFFSLMHSLSLFQKLNTKSTVSYTLAHQFINPPSNSSYFIDRHFFDVEFRRRLFKRHYYASIIPGLFATNNDQWQVRMALQLRIDIFFGNP